MEIEPILLQQGITESIINFFHSKNKNSHMTIIKVTKATLYSGDVGIKVNVTLREKGCLIQYQQYTIDLAKIRQKRINLLLNKKHE